MASRSVRKQAADAALKLMQPKLDLVSDLAEAGTEVDAAERAAEEAQRALDAKREAYLEKYRTALAGGWKDDELTRVGLSADRGRTAAGSRRRSRRSASTAELKAQEPPAEVGAAAAG